MQSKSELITALQTQKLEIPAFLSSIPGAQFFDGSSERWSVGYHVHHMTGAVNRVAQGLQNPGALPKREPATASKDFSSVRETYLEALKNTLTIGSDARADNEIVGLVHRPKSITVSNVR